MFARLVQDALDLMRFRVRPIGHYQYPLSAVILWLLCLGLASALVADTFTGGMANRLAFFMAVNVVESGLLAWFMAWWLRQSGWQGQESLFGLVVLSHTPQLLEPLLLAVPAPLDSFLAFGLAAWGITILVQALHLTTAMTRGRVIVGMILFMPIAVFALSLMLGAAAHQGWISLPQELTTPEAAPTTPAPAEPAPPNHSGVMDS